MAGKIIDKLKAISVNLNLMKNINRINYLSSLIAILFFSSTSFCQSARLPFNFVENFKIDGGAFDNRINCLFQDKNGYLWIGTNAGLKRYDSGTNVSFRHKENNPNSLVNNIVRAVCEDKMGRIWIGTIEGICYFDRTKNQFFTINELNKLDYACLNILCDYEGNIWFTIRDRGLYCFDTKTNQLKNYRNDSENPKSINSNRPIGMGLVEDPYKKGLWISTENGLNFFDHKTKIFYNKNHNPEKLSIFESSINAITIHKNQLVFGDNDQQKIAFYDIQKKIIAKTIPVKLKSGKSLFRLYKIFFDSQENIWLSSFNDISAIIKAKTNQIVELEYDPNAPNSLSDNDFKDIIQQNSGMIWLATYNGLSVIDPKNNLFDFYTLQDNSKPISGNYLNFFLEDLADSTWWFTNTDSQLISYKPLTNEFKKYKLPNSINNSFGISLQVHQKNIIVTTTQSILFFDKVKERFSKIDLPFKIPEKSNIEITQTLLQGEKLWIFFKGFDFHKAYCYHIPTKKWEFYPILSHSHNPRNGVTSAFISKKGDIWLTIHATGLAKFSPEKKAFEIIKTRQNINFDKVGFNNICEDSKGYLWISSFNLIRFNPKTNDFETIVDTDFAGSIAVDSHDNVWLNVYNDFLVYMPETKQKLNVEISVTKSEENIDWPSNLFKLKNGKILALIKERFVVIEPKFLKQSSTKDNILINRISSADTSVLIHENSSKISFKSDENSFSINYGILSPPNVNKYNFFYKLEGYDKDWVLGDNKFLAIYGKMPGGDYTFKIKAVDINNVELPTQALSIHVETVFYKTSWFLTICAVFFTFLIYQFIKFRTNQRAKIHHLQIQSTRLEKDKTEIQYQNLINHLNPHFLFNSLTSLNGLILSEPDVASDFLQKLSKIYRYILQNKESELVTLENELEFVQNYIELQKSRFEDGLQVNIDVEDQYLSYCIVPVTLQNLFENAIKHNTIADDKPLIISVFVENETLVVKNNLQKKKFVETSNKQGLESLKKLYKYLSANPFEIIETENEFIVKVPLL